MTPEEKSEQLVETFLPHAYPFSAGSGYLTGDIDEDGQKRHAKELSAICVMEIMQTCIINKLPYWQSVLTILKSKI